MKITIIWRFIVGIDISKNRLDCYLLDRQTGEGYICQVPNTYKGFEQLGGWLADHGADPSQTILISEHTGRYGEHLLRWTTTNQWPHAVVKTTALKKVGNEHHRKTDAFDAEDLADYGVRFSDKLSLTKAPKPAIGQIKRLQAERRKMVDRRAALRSKLTEANIHDADMERLMGMWTQQIALLTEHITEIEARIKELINEDATIKNRYRMMRSAPGIGKVLGPLWVSLFAGRQTLDARKISSRFGFAPHPHQSGSSVKRTEQSSGFGNSEVRRVMHQAALSVKTHCPHYREYYEKKRSEGKEHLLVINNIINKLIRLYCAMWNNRAEYDPDYIQKNKHKWKKSA
ncbi:IS110 family transposase [Rhodohalobacter sp.]|uniref:IS110 family transposase n=1 Tax=Rhodohalobacter sp. TaxID=1974210 RepID=UPI002ACDCD68|nr:transposase [Rhodohalobacter sp.]MDZ7757773.1 transposase [Rhodohalobacter sp.]